MIALVSNNTNLNSTTVPVHYLNLSAFLTQNGIANDIIEIKEPPSLRPKPVDYYDGLVIDKLKRKDYEYVGLSCYTTDYNYTIALTRKIKQAFPNIKIILGGVHVTLRPQDPFLSRAPLDFVVIGEGEFPLLEILANKRPFEEIDGIAFLKDDKVMINKPRCLSKDLSHLPLPAYDKIDMDFYLRPNHMGIRFLITSTVHIFTGFGCPFSCVFCANTSLYKAQNSGKVVRYKSIDQVFNEINFLKQGYGMESFYIQDDTFTLNKKRVEEICNRLIDEKINLLWGAETRVDALDKELIKKMKKAGCRQLDFGVEVTTQAALDRMKKGTKIEDVHRAFAACRKHGVRTGANIMLNTPGETEEDIYNMRRFLKKLKADAYYIALTVPFLGTEIYDRYVHPKLKLEEYKLYENPYLYGAIKDERFRLTEHNLPLEKILMRLRVLFYIPKLFLDIPLKGYYIRYFCKSRYRLAILRQILTDFTTCLFKGMIFLFYYLWKKPQRI